MQIIINIDQSNKITALTRATIVYNNIHNTTLTPEQFLTLVTNQNLDAYVVMHTKSALTKFEFLN